MSEPTTAAPEPTTAAPEYAVAAAAQETRRLHVGWIIPPFFHEIPVDVEDADAAAERLYDVVKEVLAHGTEDEQLRMFLIYATLVGELRDAGAVYAGFCAMDMGGRPSTATVAVYRIPLQGITADQVLAETYAGLRRAHPDDDIQVSDLPCGKGVVRIGGAPFTLAAEVSPTGEPVEVPRGQIQVYVPLPNDADLLVFELSTPSMEDWDFYSEIFAEIVRTLDWGTDEEVEMATVLSQAPSIPDVAPDPAVVQELYACSSRVLDSLAVRGRMDQGNQVSAVTCPDCWSKGLRSACAVRHQWQVEEVEDEVLAAALGRLDGQLQAGGWFKLAETEGRSVALAADGGSGPRVSAALIPGQRRLVVEVTAPCTRTVRGTGDSVFG
ncbi:hypothetical protein ACH429_05165 [Streptomyces pathocidini]|uniref:Uncharacterized protein n=1 Tax=Streptomyces pathocidini TaxID=1650571 RepID=A0ABW7ULI1_9ACTN|nr:hypothetical protein [Streptomyces pathocidini]